MGERENMEYPSSSEIRTRLVDYLAGRSSFAEFHRWLIPATWDIELTGDTEASDLTDTTSLRIAEYLNGDCMEAELRNLLQPLVATTTINFHFRTPAARPLVQPKRVVATAPGWHATGLERTHYPTGVSSTELSFSASR